MKEQLIKLLDSMSEEDLKKLFPLIASLIDKTHNKEVEKVGKRNQPINKKDC